MKLVAWISRQLATGRVSDGCQAKDSSPEILPNENDERVELEDAEDTGKRRTIKPTGVASRLVSQLGPVRTKGFKTARFS
jgi:hypothetical protein